ncbi:MAG: hypothetical protein NVS2B16_33060 [Chloroflexota bacterium]
MTVVVVGLGDLGGRVFHALAAVPSIHRLIGAGRSVERGREHAGGAALVAELVGGPRSVEYQQIDLGDSVSTARALQRLDPEIIVMAASRHTWWRPRTKDARRTAELARLPYGAWLPLLISPVRALMEARKDAGVRARVVCLPYPDAVGAALAPLGLAPELGSGNVTEVAAKLRLLTSRLKGVSRDEVTVRLIMHHAAERDAFGVFTVLQGAGERGAAPWIAEVTVGGVSLLREDVERLFRSVYPLPPGRESHILTAGATVHLVKCMLSAEPQATHVPGPNGLPGGYPVLLGPDGIQLDLPVGVTEQDALDTNRHAARWDGIEAIETDGTVVFTGDVARESLRVLGIELERVRPSDMALVADEMELRLQTR